MNKHINGHSPPGTGAASIRTEIQIYDRISDGRIANVNSNIDGTNTARGITIHVN